MEPTIKRTYAKLLGIFIICFTLCFVFAKIEKTNVEYDPLKTTYYDASGRLMKAYRVWDGIITPTTATGQTIDITSAGFTSISTIELTAANNTTTVTSMPIVMIKSYTNTSVVCNILTSNVGVLSILQGLVGPTTLTGMTIHAHITGN